MKYIKLYENFQEKKPISNKDWNEFSKVNKKFRKRLWIRKNLFDNGDGTFDYDGNLSFSYMKIKSLNEVMPLPVKNVSGNFFCQHCKELETLKGAPQSVDGDFSCIGCEGLDTLKYAPQSVGKKFNCEYCTGLTTLQGAPQSVGDSFNCNVCTGLTDLKYAPQSVGKDFYCSGCTGLTDLKYAPQSVGKIFSCWGCTGLTSLKGAPQSVGGDFYCWGCTGLTSLKYAPQSVGKDYWCGVCTGLISDINDYDYDIVEWKGYSKEGIQEHLNSEQFSLPVWFESLVFIGARDPKAFNQVCKDFPNETTFTDKQIEEIYKSELIDQESTLVDAAKAGLPVPQDIMDRTKKYDHSEYRDSKLDSEWKDVF